MQSREPHPDDEFFDVVDENGIATGRVKRRSDVHRDGDWHYAFHCWVALQTAGGEPAILFQRRSMNKDTYPGKLDVAVGGHYRSGEGFDEVVREIEEELGIAPPSDALVPIGRRWAEGVTDSWIDREIEDVYVYLLSEPVTSLRPAFEEITAIDVITAPAIDALFSETSNTVGSTRYLVSPENVPGEPFRAEVTRDDFITVSDGYWPCGTRAAVKVLDGQKNVRLHLG